MARFNNDTYRSLNESIEQVQNPQAALNEALEYASALEEVLLSLCEELDLDPQALMEDIQTPERKREMRPLVRKARKQQAAAQKKAERKINRVGRPGEPSSYTSQAKDKVYAKYRDRRADKILAKGWREDSNLTTLYGKGGKVVATRKLVPQHYGAWKPTKPKPKRNK